MKIPLTLGNSKAVESVFEDLTAYKQTGMAASGAAVSCTYSGT